MKADFLAYAFVSLGGIAAAVLGTGVAHAAQATCPDDPAAAVAQAKAALSSPDTSKDRAALVCLTEAVGALDAKLNDLIAGKVQFTGNLVTSGDVKGRTFIHRAVDTPDAKGDR